MEPLQGLYRKLLKQGNDTVVAFVGLIASGGSPANLSCRELAAVLGVSKDQASRLQKDYIRFATELRQEREEKTNFATELRQKCDNPPLKTNVLSTTFATELRQEREEKTNFATELRQKCDNPPLKNSELSTTFATELRQEREEKTNFATELRQKCDNPPLKTNVLSTTFATELRQEREKKTNFATELRQKCDNPPLKNSELSTTFATELRQERENKESPPSPSPIPPTPPIISPTIPKESSFEKRACDAREEKAKHFIPPTVDEVAAYLRQKGYTDVDPESFVAFYKSKGWMIGKNKMKNWHAAITTWRKRRQDEILRQRNSYRRKTIDLGVTKTEEYFDTTF